MQLVSSNCVNSKWPARFLAKENQESCECSFSCKVQVMINNHIFTLTENEFMDEKSKSEHHMSNDNNDKMIEAFNAECNGLTTWYEASSHGKFIWERSWQAACKYMNEECVKVCDKHACLDCCAQYVSPKIRALIKDESNG